MSAKSTEYLRELLAAISCNDVDSACNAANDLASELLNCRPVSLPVVEVFTPYDDWDLVEPDQNIWKV